MGVNEKCLLDCFRKAAILCQSVRLFASHPIFPVSSKGTQSLSKLLLILLDEWLCEQLDERSAASGPEI